MKNQYIRRAQYKKGFIVPLLLAVIALLVIGGGIYIYNNKKAEAPTVVDTGVQQTNQVQQRTQTSANGQGGNQINIPSNSTTPVASNLSLYKSESCGFEISFPSQFVNWNRPLDQRLKQCPNSIPNEGQISALNLKSQVDCNINSVGESPAGCSFFEVSVSTHKVEIAGGDGVTEKSFVVDNIPADKIISLDSQLGQIYIQFQKNKLWYRYTHTFSPSDAKEAEKLSDLIISTFKFTK